ncbi:MAG: hypothetical protein ACOCUR_03085, partial [Nanoarchaeota archaeon]
SLSSKEMDELFEIWNLTEEEEFKIHIYDRNDETIYEFKTSEPLSTDVFSRTFSDYLIDQYGRREFVFVNINIW